MGQGEWKIVLNKENKPLEEGNIASVIEEAVLEDTYRGKRTRRGIRRYTKCD